MQILSCQEITVGASSTVSLEGFVGFNVTSEQTFGVKPLAANKEFDLTWTVNQNDPGFDIGIRNPGTEDATVNFIFLAS